LEIITQHTLMTWLPITPAGQRLYMVSQTAQRSLAVTRRLYCSTTVKQRNRCLFTSPPVTVPHRQVKN